MSREEVSLKRILAGLLAVLLAAGCTMMALAEEHAEILDQMTEEQLLALHDEIYAKLYDADAEWLDEKWSSGEPVTVTAGVYRIGKDIPAGEWILMPKDKEFLLVINTEFFYDKTKSLSTVNSIYDRSTHKAHTESERLVCLRTDTYLELNGDMIFSKK